MNPEPGWYRDPYFLKHERYWDNGWTDQVRRVEPEQAPLEQGPADTTEQSGGAATTSESTAERPQPATDATSSVDAATSRLGGPAGAAAFGLTTHAAQPERAGPPTASYPAQPAIGDVARAGGDEQALPKRALREDDTLVVPVLTDLTDTDEVPAVLTDTNTVILPTVPGTAAPGEHRGRTSAQQVLPWESSSAAQDEAVATRARARRRRIGFVVAGLAFVALAVVATVFAIAGG